MEEPLLQSLSPRRVKLGARHRPAPACMPPATLLNKHNRQESVCILMLPDCGATSFLTETTPVPDAETLPYAHADLAKANSVACVLAEGGTEKTSEVKSVRVPVGDAW